MSGQKGAQTVVIDNGSNFCRAGFAGDEEPKTIFPSVIGKPKIKSTTDNTAGVKDHYVGKDVLSRRDILFPSYPIFGGVISNWDSMEKIWQYTFYEELKVMPEKHTVLLTEIPLNEKQKRQKMAQIMFESFSVPAMYIAVTAVLSLYANCLTTGVSLDSGDSVSYVTPVYEGHVLPHATLRLNLGGGDLTNYMIKILMERGYCFNIAPERKIVTEIKEKLCCVALDFDDQMKNSQLFETSYELPDGTIITIGNERFRCPEILFQPSLVDLETCGIHQMIFNSIGMCDDGIRKNLYSNLVLSGGNCMVDGIAERITKELTCLAPPTTRIRIFQPPHRDTAVWIGGSILGSRSDFEQISMTKEEYKEYGANIVHRKCF